MNLILSARRMFAGQIITIVSVVDDDIGQEIDRGYAYDEKAVSWIVDGLRRVYPSLTVPDLSEPQVFFDHNKGLLWGINGNTYGSIWFEDGVWHLLDVRRAEIIRCERWKTALTIVEALRFYP